MRIVIAPQGFKGCAPAKIIAETIARGIKQALPSATCVLAPVADGGDGTLDILLEAKKGQRQQSLAMNAHKILQEVSWGILPGHPPLAIIETAAICGLAQLPPLKRHPLLATSYGVGQVVLQALDKGCRDFFIGLGGTATNDAGTGLAQALGARFLNDQGLELPLGGAALVSLEQIDLSGLDPRLRECRIIVGCDVLNPLLGENGASRIYAPQKGASPEEVAQLEKALQHFADVVFRQFKQNIAIMPFGGAAGGMAAGLSFFLQTELVSGAEWILKTMQFDRLLEGADLVIVAEGRLDGQTSYLKAPMAVAQAAKKLRLPVLALAGTLGKDSHLLHQCGIDAFVPVSFIPIDAPPNNALDLLAQTAEEAMRCLLIRK